MAAQILCRNLTLGYRRQPAVRDLSGLFAPGSLTAVIGPNGGGKSTLLKGIMGVLRPLAGSVAIEGIDRRDIAYLPQQAAIDPEFPISVQDTVRMGLWRRIGAFRAVDRQLAAVAERALAAVGLAGMEDRSLAALSVGQRQRVMFARALVADSPLILLDEPFAAVDARTTADLLGVILRWRDEGRTVVAVLHDHDQVRRHFPQCLLLARDAFGWGPTAEVLTPDNLLRARVAGETWEDEGETRARGAA